MLHFIACHRQKNIIWKFAVNSWRQVLACQSKMVTHNKGSFDIFIIVFFFPFINSKAISIPVVTFYAVMIMPKYGYSFPNYMKNRLKFRLFRIEISLSCFCIYQQFGEINQRGKIFPTFIKFRKMHIPSPMITEFLENVTQYDYSIP